MNNLSTGTGLALLATAIVAYPIVNRINSIDQTAHASLPVAAIAAAATAQASPEPTIVWYGTSTSYGPEYTVFWRAWSDGKVEYRRVNPGAPSGGWCGPNSGCTSPWFVANDPSQGLTYRSDINFDERVDGADLATMLADWGDAPRFDIPPSDCPLALINP